MHISEIKQEIIDNYRLKIASFVWGPPGVGKSELVKQVAADLNIKCKDERVPTLDPVDLRGVPSVENGFTLFNIPTLLPDEKRDGPNGIFFLDELSSAQPAMQAAAYQLTLDRRVGDYVLPDGWSIVAAGNEVGDKAVAYRQSTALANRFGHYDLEVSVDEWLAHGVTIGYSEDLLAFIKYKPALLHDQTVADNGGHAFPSPRSWSFVNAHHSFMTPQNEFNKIRAFVGEGPAAEFNHFMKIVRELPTITEILQSPKTAKVPEALDAVHATTGTLLGNVTEKNFKTIMKYVNRIPKEFQALFVLEAIQRNEDLSDTKEANDWFVKTKKSIL